MTGSTPEGGLDVDGDSKIWLIDVGYEKLRGVEIWVWSVAETASPDEKL